MASGLLSCGPWLIEVERIESEKADGKPLFITYGAVDRMALDIGQLNCSGTASTIDKQ
jgi:hypothetical protein